MAVRQVGNRPRPLLRLLAFSLPFRGNSSIRNHSEPRERSKPYTTTTSTRRTCSCMQFACGSGKASMRHFFLTSHSSATRHQWLKGELNPEMKLCELLVLGHCIHLPLILFACAPSGQSYNVGSPVPPNFCDVIDTAMTRDPIAF